MYFVFEPIYQFNNSLFAFECLTRHKKPANQGHDYYECFFKTATPDFLTQLAEQQIDFIIENYAFFHNHNVRVNVNVDVAVLKNLVDSDRNKLLTDYQLINFEIDLSRNFPAQSTSAELLSLFNGRLWLDDVSPANILLAANLLTRFEFVKIDKSYFWETKKSALGTQVFELFLSYLQESGIRVVAEGINCKTYAESMKETTLFGGQGFYWRTSLADEIASYCSSAQLKLGKKDLLKSGNLNFTN